MPASTAGVFALAALTRSHPAAQDAATESGALEALLRLLETASQPLIARVILDALGTLVDGMPAIQATVAAVGGLDLVIARLQVCV